MDQVVCAAISSHPAVVPLAEKVSYSSSNCQITARPMKQLKYRNYQRLRCKASPNYLARSSRYIHHLVHALPLQAVTMDNDSEGSTSQGSSPSVEYVGNFPSEQGPRQSLMYYVQVWYSNTRKHGVSTSIKQVLVKSKTELQSLDKEELIEQLKTSKLASSLLNWWLGVQPWIKWPITIFASWFIVVSTFYGTSVSTNLLPLWIIGPLIVGLSIKASIQFSALCKHRFTEAKFRERTTSLIESLKSGELWQHYMAIPQSSYEKVKHVIFQRPSELVSFIQSGDVLIVLKQYSSKKFQELSEASIDKYEDVRLLYLYLERKLKNII